MHRRPGREQLLVRLQLLPAIHYSCDNNSVNENDDGGYIVWLEDSIVFDPSVCEPLYRRIERQFPFADRSGDISSHDKAAADPTDNLAGSVPALPPDTRPTASTTGPGGGKISVGRFSRDVGVRAPYHLPLGSLHDANTRAP